MSRCFPFPPPGYEKEARTDDADLLKKEKHREKKHKKEKREKEKKEGKDKKEKDRGDGKHREKKDRKDKHRDKKKDKEDRDKGKNSTSDEKRLASGSEGCNEEKVCQKEKDKDKDKNSISKEKRFPGQFVGCSEEKLRQSSHLAEGNEDSKFLQELGRRIRDEDRGSGNQLVEKFGTGWKKDEAMVKLVAKDIGACTEGMEKSKDKRGDYRKIDGQGAESRISGNSVAQNFSGSVQHRLEGTPKPLENMERRMEGKEKTKEKEGDDKRGEKREDRGREKKSHGKDKERDKEKKKEEKVKVKIEQKNMEQDKSKETNKDGLTVHNIKTSHVHKDSNKSSSTEGNLKKRKDSDTNGFLHASKVKPNKLPRSTSHPVTENGRKLEPCQTSILITSDRQGGTANNVKVDNKERKLNGIIDDRPFSVNSTKPLSGPSQADHIAAVSKKPPHPDSKYLGQVLSVPKMEEWCDFDEQEWLFSSSVSQSEKLKVDTCGVDETAQVWAEALQIESADVCALPYVIPY